MNNYTCNMQHATCNMQHATCNKRATIFMKLLAALILTAAALATPSASAYLATYRDGIHWGFAVDATTAMAANQQAEMECEMKAQSGNCSSTLTAANRDTNLCIAISIGNLTINGNTQISTTVAIFHINDITARDARETIKASAQNLNGLNIPGIQFTPVDLGTRDVCDATCTNNYATNDYVPPLAIYEDDIAGCERVKSNADCRIVAARDGHDREYVDTNANGETICREELACSEGNRIPNGSGGCTICDANQMADGDNDECIPLIPVEVTMTVNTETEVTVNTETEVTVTRVTMVETIVEIETLVTIDGMLVTVTNTVTNNSGNPINTIIENDDREKTAALAAGVAVGVGALVLGLYYFINKKPGIIVYEPSYSFRNNNGILSYSVGNRWTANSENWRFYWQANQSDRFVYGSGIGYNNGLLSAAINSQSEKDKTALDLALSANKTFGLWNLGGGYNFDMQLSDTETDTKNRINAKIRYTVDKWILSANANTDGNTGTARINYSYRF